MTAPLRGLGDEISHVGAIAAGVALANIGMAITKGIVEHVSSAVGEVVTFGKAVSELQRVVGGSAETNSALLSVFERYSLNVDDATKSLGIFSKHLAGLEDDEDGVMTGGKKFNAVMDDMGIAFLGVNGLARPMNDLLLEVADKFQKMGPSADRTAMAMQLFGKSGKDLLPILNLGSKGMLEAEEASKKYGMTLTNENLAAVRDYGLAHKDLEEAIKGVELQVGVLAMPLMVKFAQTIAVLAQNFNQFAIPKIKEFANALTGFFVPKINAAVAAIKDILGYLDPSNQYDLMRAWFGPDIGPRIDVVVRGIEGFAATLTTIKSTIDSLNPGAILAYFGGQAIQSILGFGQALGDVSAQVSQFEQGVVAAIGGLLKTGDIGKALADINDYFVEAFNISPGEVLANLGQLFVNIATWIAGQVAPLVAQLEKWGAAFVTWIADVVPKLPAELATLGQAVYAWIVGQVTMVANQLVAWAQAFSAWVGPAIPPMIAELEKLKTALLDWINETTPQISAALVSWGNAFIAWIGPATTNFLAEWPKMLNAFLDWIEQGAVPILEQLGKWGLAFVAWIVPRIPDILTAAAAIPFALMTFIDETKAVLEARLIKWGLAFVNWIPTMIPALLVELAKIGLVMDNWIAEQATKMAQGLANVATGGRAFPAPTASSGAGGGPTGSTSTGPNITVHVNGVADPNASAAGATAGVLAASRAFGFT